MNKKNFLHLGASLVGKLSLVGIGAFCGTTIYEIIIQIIGNHAEAGFIWLMRQNAFPWIIVGLLSLICIAFVLYGWPRIAILRRDRDILRQELNQELAIVRRTRDQSNKMLALDDSLFRLLATWRTSPTNSSEGSEQLKLILKEILIDSTVEFDGHVERAAILLPDPTDYLKCWADYQMPQDSIDAMKFYIGNDPKTQREKGGVAGASFQSGEILVGHMTNPWTCDQEDYVKFQGKRHFCPYASFVTVPVIGISTKPNETTCLGVICFDSKRDSSFDSDEIKLVLVMIARRVASALLIGKNLHNIELK